MVDWRRLEKDFRDIPDPFSDMRADWSDQPGLRNHWQLAGGGDAFVRARFDALARQVGRFLLASEVAIGKCSSDLRAIEDDMARWLTAVREITRRFEFSPPGTLYDDNNTPVGNLYWGTIPRVIEASALLCFQLSTEETVTSSNTGSDSKISIQRVDGDVVISQNQHGGLTSHTSVTDIVQEERKGRSLLKWLIYVLIPLLAAIVTILGYLGVHPTKNKLLNEKQSNQVTGGNSGDGIKTQKVQEKAVKKQAKQSPIEKVNQPLADKENEKTLDRKEDKSISIGNVGGNAVISQNQSGGITAHTVNVGPQARKLTKEQKVAFVDYLRNNPKGDIIIEVKGPDKEPNDFANELEELLKQSGWNIRGHMTSLVGNYDAKGMGLLVHSKESAPRYINSLYRAFKRIGMDIQAEVADSRPEGSLTLAIGYVPD